MAALRANCVKFTEATYMHDTVGDKNVYHEVYSFAEGEATCVISAVAEFRINTVLATT